MGTAVDFLTYYYMAGTPPFRSLSALPDEQAIEIMRSLYEETVLWSRFRDPAGYLQGRRETERWVREEFLIKGGDPRETCPVHMVLGASPWLVKHGPQDGSGAEIRIPISAFTERDSTSLTGQHDSIWFSRDKPGNLPARAARQGVHNVEIRPLSQGMEEGWKTFEDLAPTLARVWNLEPLVYLIRKASETWRSDSPSGGVSSSSGLGWGAAQTGLQLDFDAFQQEAELLAMQLKSGCLPAVRRYCRALSRTDAEGIDVFIASRAPGVKRSD
jgi:hypothetical protein